MKISYKDKFDLYQRGNYEGSFDSLEEVEKHLEKEYEYKVKYREIFGDALKSMNEWNYTVMKSQRIVFEERT